MRSSANSEIDIDIDIDNLSFNIAYSTSSGVGNMRSGCIDCVEYNSLSNSDVNVTLYNCILTQLALRRRS